MIPCRPVLNTNIVSLSGEFAGNVMTCKVCEGKNQPLFRARVLQKYEVEYFWCERCGYVCTESPFWLPEAYSDAIARTDTGILARNLKIANILALFIPTYFAPEAAFVDMAGGYGILTRLMRDRGFEFYWSDEYCENLVARGFEVESGPDRFAAVTAFEVLEHVEDPLGFVSDALAKSNAQAFIFSTELYTAGVPPSPAQWPYYSLDTGQHISFYSKRTLEYMAGVLGCHFDSNGIVHMFSRRSISRWRFRIFTNHQLAQLAALVMKYNGRSKTQSDRDLVSRSLR